MASLFFHLFHYHGMNVFVPLKNSYVEALTFGVAAFRDGASEEVRKVK